MVSWFLSECTKHSPIQIIDLWMADPAGRAGIGHDEYEIKYSLEVPYYDIRYIRSAITSMAAQLINKLLVKEQEVAVMGKNGLHGSGSTSRN